MDYSKPLVGGGKNSEEATRIWSRVAKDNRSLYGCVAAYDFALGYSNCFDWHEFIHCSCYRDNSYTSR